MASLRRGFRAELASILDVDMYTLEENSAETAPPSEATSGRLGRIIAHSIAHPEEARGIYEFLPVLLLRVFGYAPGHGWLESAAELPRKDREALVRLVMPDGPVHAFCKKHSPPRHSKLNVLLDMRFEFQRSNLPEHTDSALDGDPTAALHKRIKDSQSFLAPLLESSLRDHKDAVLYLSPLDYFFICMIASPTRKWTRSSGGVTPGGRRMKRSVSLPSTRALYNQIVASYASSLKGDDRVDGDSIFIATCLDYLFVPWASYVPSKRSPVVSTAAAETVAALLLGLVPRRPRSLDLDVDYEVPGIPETVDWNMQTNTSVIYRAAEAMLESVFAYFHNSAPTGTFIVYIRILSLFVAPWRTSIRNVLRATLFPKPSSTVDGEYNTMAAITSKLSSFNAQLASQARSPRNASDVKESQWCLDLKRRQANVDIELVRLVVVKAANCRLPALPEGGRALGLLSEAVKASCLTAKWSGYDKDMDKAEELRSYLMALRNQKMDVERTGARRETNYVRSFSSALGVYIEGTGVFGGISDFVGAGGASSVAGVVNMVSGSKSSSPGSHLKTRIRERRFSALRAGSATKDVPFLGNVWDRPISESENELVVMWLYWLALRLEPRLGFVPNLRFLGRYWFLMLSSIVLCTTYLVSRLV